MVYYRPPENVQLMIGACHRGAPVVSAGKRLAAVVETDVAKLTKLGIPDDVFDEINNAVAAVERALRDAAVRKNDTGLQMEEVAETMVRIRHWLSDLRSRALIALSLDRPAVKRVFSSAPEIRDGYPRDLLEELRELIRAASDLRPRLEDVGVTDRFIGKGRRLSAQLSTAIGKNDLSPKNLQLKMTRHYMKKGQLFILLKQVERAGRHAFWFEPQRRRLYHLRELEPPEAALPKPKATS